MATATEEPAQKIFPASGGHFAALLGGNAALALGPWLVRLADTGPVAAGFWRVLLPLPLLAILAWRERIAVRMDNRLLAMLAAAGAFFALDLSSWHMGIERTRLGNATLFGNLGSVILMIRDFLPCGAGPARAKGWRSSPRWRGLRS